MNHGQVHHNFGSKRRLIVRTMERIEASFNEQLVGAGDVNLEGLIEEATSRRSFTRMLAWLVLEGGDMSDVRGLRTGRLLSEGLQAEGWTEDDAIVAATQIMVLTGGWSLLHPALIEANELETESVARVSEALQRLAASLVLAVPENGATGDE